MLQRSCTVACGILQMSVNEVSARGCQDFTVGVDKIVKLTNCRILFRDELIVDDLWIQNGKIQNKAELFFKECRSPDFVIDCHNSIISPGFIDIQINGGFGIDFSNPDTSLSDLSYVADQLLSFGVTSFCPTVISSPAEVYAKLLPKYNAYMKDTVASSSGSNVLGLHLEGPFISIAKRGMHSPDVLATCENGLADLLERYKSLEGVAIVTVAPEIPGSGKAIRELKELGVSVSLGHSSSGLETGETAVKEGASCLTHLFCAMQPFHHRDPCLIGLLASKRTDRQVYFGIIADLIHTHAAALRLAYRINPKGLILVSDANPIMKCEDGTYTFGTETIEMREGRSYVQGTNTLSGATTPLDACARNFLRTTGAGIAKTLQYATLHPAEFLGITKRKGVLEPGTDADLVFLDDELRVKSTWLRGRLVYSDKGVVYSMKKLFDS